MANTNSSTHESFRDSFTFLGRFISKLRYFAREAACGIVGKSQRPKALDLCIHSRSCVGYAFRGEESFFGHQKAMLCRGVPRFPRRVAEILDDPKQIGAPISYKTGGCYSSYAKTFEGTFGANFIKDDTYVTFEDWLQGRCDGNNSFAAVDLMADMGALKKLADDERLRETEINFHAFGLGGHGKCESSDDGSEIHFHPIDLNDPGFLQGWLKENFTADSLDLLSQRGGHGAKVYDKTLIPYDLFTFFHYLKPGGRIIFQLESGIIDSKYWDRFLSLTKTRRIEGLFLARPPRGEVAGVVLDKSSDSDVADMQRSQLADLVDALRQQTPYLKLTRRSLS